MNIFYAFLAFFQMLQVLLRHDRNQFPSLMCLWSNEVLESTPAGSRIDLARGNSNYKETKSETTNSEYPLVMER
jgi:hypothetical protein